MLIIRPRDVGGMKEVVDYANQNQVKIISYDSLIENESIDLFVGYDSEHVGQRLANYLAETVPSGDYILVWGDVNRNVEDMLKGAAKYLNAENDQINILLETGVPGWSTDKTKQIVMETVAANEGKVDAIFAFSDKLAGACAEAVAELGIEQPVAIAGMDAELDAVRRIVAGTQSCTAYMALKGLSNSTIDHAISLASGEKGEINSEISNGSDAPIPAFLLTRQIVDKQNLDRVLVDSGYYTKEQVYGTGEDSKS